MPVKRKEAQASGRGELREMISQVLGLEPANALMCLLFTNVVPSFLFPTQASLGINIIVGVIAGFVAGYFVFGRWGMVSFSKNG